MYLPKTCSHQPRDNPGAVQELCFFWAELWCRDVCGTCMEFPELPVNCECSKIIRHLFFLLLPAFCHRACGHSAVEWFRLHLLRTAAGRPHGDRGMRKGQKTLKPLLSREDEVNVDYKPECPIKIAEVAAFTSNSTTANPGKDRMGMKRTKDHIFHLL